MPRYSARTHAYVLGRQAARHKLGFDTEEDSLKDLLVAQIQDEVEGVGSYEDLATAARDAGKDDIAQVMEGNAEEEGHHAHEDSLALKQAARKLTDPTDDPMFYGDDTLPTDARLWDLQRELGKINATSLPDQQTYQSESGRRGALGGGLFGGAMGGALGGASHGLKGMAMGGLAGAAGGAGLGYLGGRSVGKSDHEADTNLQIGAGHMMQDPQSQIAALHRAKTNRDGALSAQQLQHEEMLARIERERFNHNHNYDEY